MKTYFDQSIVRQSNFPAAVTPGLYLPDGSPYQRHENSAEKKTQHISVTGTLALPQDARCACRLVETIRDPKDAERLVFLDWQDGRWDIVPQIECRGKVYVPPSASGGLVSRLTLPTGVLPCGELSELFADLRTTILEFIEISDRDLLLIQSFILADLFPDLFDDVPYLALIGPLGSAKTKLLKLLSCFCRRALLVGDIRAAALYQIADSSDTTLLIDELEFGGSKSDSGILRLLRTGSTRGTGVVRNGKLFSTFGFKVVASRHLPADAALASRFIVISMLPTTKELKVLNREEMRLIAEKFQPRLLMFRLTHYSAVRDFRIYSRDLDEMTPRARQLARVLAAPLEGNPRAQADLIALLREQDRDMRVERSLEPEWLVEEALFALCHEGLPNGALVYSDTLVGGIADEANEKLKQRGEDSRLKARRVGAVLKSLGFKTEGLGNRGRGLRITQAFQMKVHEVARRLGIDRIHITSTGFVDRGHGGMPCALCEEFGLTAGLRYVAPDPWRPRRPSGSPRVPLFDKKELKDLGDDVLIG